MGDFFKGWRRKLGVLTLVVACVATAGWVRSLSLFEGITCPTGTRFALGLISNNQYVLCIVGLYGCRSSQIVAGFPELEWDSRKVEAVNELYEPNDISWRLGWRHFGVFYSQRQGATLCIVPYWAIVIPMTAVSAYLLLTKLSQQQVPELTANEGT